MTIRSAVITIVICSLIESVRCLPPNRKDNDFGQLAGNVNENRADAPKEKADSQNQEARQPNLNDGNHNLIKKQECASEINTYCRDVKFADDITMLQCLLDKVPSGGGLSAACEHVLWQTKVEVTKDDRFNELAGEFCGNELKKLTDCRKVTTISGHLISCLLDHKDEMSVEGQCKSFLTRIESIVFTDYRLIGSFVDACTSEISKLKCGRLVNDDKSEGDRTHSQGGTIDCLLNKLVELGASAKDLGADCRKQILRVAEWQSDDFHLDRPLYFACLEDRERFCPDVQAGDGKVLACLLRHVQDSKMDDKCRQKLVVRQRLIGRDYKVSRSLVRACGQDIKENQCAPPNPDDSPEHFYLSYILLCLEDAVKSKGKTVTGECEAQMFDHRRSLMSDFSMSPELMLSCSNDISQFCGQPERGGQTLHCLMDKMRNEAEGRRISGPCQQALRKVVKAADIGSDYRVDPILDQSCGRAIESLCQDRKATEADVLSCLMDNVDSKLITEECEKRLLEVQYFLSRDFALDPALYKACKAEAVSLCHAKDSWLDMADKENDPEHSPLVLPCLYRHAYELPSPVDKNGKSQESTPLSKPCTLEVQRVMRERAVSARLMPELADACLHDLAMFCSDKTGPGEELSCLQDHVNDEDGRSAHTADKPAYKMAEKCREQVQAFTQAESMDIRLNRALTKACKPVIETYCRENLALDVDHGDVMECLQKFRNEPEMSNKCSAYVNHYELVSMQDYSFSYKFKKACKQDVETQCPGTINDKFSVIRCLSDIMFRHQLLPDTSPGLAKECRKQLKKEYLAAGQNDDIMRPKLKEKCGADLAKLCPGVQGHTNMIECLRDHKNDLTGDCKQFIFRNEQMQFADNTLDAKLQSACATVIAATCRNVDREHVLSCLKRAKHDPAMTPDCLEVVSRRQAEQVSDIRLQPSVRKHCEKEIKGLCQKEWNEVVNDKSQKISDAPKDLSNPVLKCLRRNFARRDSSIGPSCRTELRQIIMDSHLDQRMDPMFFQICFGEVKRLCSESIAEVGNDKDEKSKTFTDKAYATALECMKSQYYQSRITDKQCQAEMKERTKEELADIHIDAGLFEACADDLQRYCNDIPQGSGRKAQCLLSALEVSTIQIGAACRGKLEERKALWATLLKEDKPASVLQFAQAINESQAKNSILLVLTGCLLFIFIFGLCCGRVTKRVKRELKNK